MTSSADILFNPEREDNARTIESIRRAQSTPLGDLRRENVQLRRRIDALEAKDAEQATKIEQFEHVLASQASAITMLRRLVKIGTPRGKIDLSGAVSPVIDKIASVDLGKQLGFELPSKKSKTWFDVKGAIIDSDLWIKR